jgi:hypothetical protein
MVPAGEDTKEAQ